MSTQLVRSCPMKHYCERESFKLKNSYDPSSPAHLHQYEVWDPFAYLSPDWDDPTTNEEMVLSSDDKSECEAFIQQGAQRCVIRENGVCEVCNLYDKRQADQKEGKVLPFYIVHYGISRSYGGPEEGGWWYDRTSINEVRRAFTLQQALKHAHDLKDKYGQPRFNRFSCANRGEDDNYMVLCYGENDPRWPKETTQRPRYE